MGFPILVRWHLYIESGPCPLRRESSAGRCISYKKNGNARTSLLWRHNERDGASNHQPHDCLLDRLFRCKSKTTSRLRVTGLCVGNLPMAGEFSTQKASNAENVSIWWRHYNASMSWRVIFIDVFLHNCWIAVDYSKLVLWFQADLYSSSRHTMRNDTLTLYDVSDPYWTSITLCGFVMQRCPPFCRRHVLMHFLEL